MVNRFVFGSSFDLFLADESGVAFSLSSSTESEITFVGGSLSVSASEVTARYKEREKGGGDGEREILSRYVRPVSTATLARAPEFFFQLVFLI